jgi:hypothetical protein
VYTYVYISINIFSTYMNMNAYLFVYTYIYTYICKCIYIHMCMNINESFFDDNFCKLRKYLKMKQYFHGISQFFRWSEIIYPPNRAGLIQAGGSIYIYIYLYTYMYTSLESQRSFPQ